MQLLQEQSTCNVVSTREEVADTTNCFPPSLAFSPVCSGSAQGVAVVVGGEEGAVVSEKGVGGGEGGMGWSLLRMVLGVCALVVAFVLMHPLSRI